MTSIICRPMRVEDLSAIASLERRVFTSPWSEDMLRDELCNPRSRYIVLENDGVILAYAGCWLIYEEAHVNNVAVAPESRGAGLGERIMRELAMAAYHQGAKSMTLEVRVSNLAAKSLYSKLGFVTRGIRKNYYSDTQEDALIMWLDDISTLTGGTV